MSLSEAESKHHKRHFFIHKLNERTKIMNGIAFTATHPIRLHKLKARKYYAFIFPSKIWLRLNFQ